MSGEVDGESSTDHSPTQGAPVTTVLFDLGGVLVRIRAEEYMEELGFSQREKEFFHCHVLFHEEWQRWDEGVLTQEKLVELLSEKEPEHAAVIRKFFDGIERFVEPYSGVESLLNSLKERGFRIYALSNYPVEMYNLHEKKALPFLSLFDGKVISGFERSLKPNEDFYRILLTRFNLNPSDCVFVDDREANTRTAETLGIHSILAKNRANALVELEAYLAKHS